MYFVDSGVKTVFGVAASGPSELREKGMQGLVASKDWISKQQ